MTTEAGTLLSVSQCNLGKSSALLENSQHFLFSSGVMKQWEVRTMVQLSLGLFGKK